MANTDKDILITPNNGSSSADPKIEFKGADASTSAQTITATAYPTNNGTLSFDGSAGQLFSITNDMTGTIFSVNDVSGIPSIEVDDDGTIRFAEYSGNILVGQTADSGEKLQVERDTDNSAEIGRAHVGYIGWADWAGFSHVDSNGTGSYALLQNPAGATLVNAASGQSISFNINNGGIANISSSGMNIYGDLNTVDNIYVAARMYHEGDTDTFVGMETNAIRLRTGGEDFYFDSQGLFITGGSLAEAYNGLSGTTPTCNVDNAGAFSLTMTGNTTFTFSGPNSGYSQGFVLQLTGNGGTVTWPASVDWAGGTAPDAPASGETDIYVFWTRDGGTTWYGVQSVDAAA